jgi:maleamate amidohydrolase
MAAWDGLIPADELEVYRRAGYGKSRGFGRWPALLVVDMEYNFTGHVPEPILESIARYPNSSGFAAWEAIPHIRRLIDLARERGVPIAYTHGIDRPQNGPNERRPRQGNAVVDELAPREGELVIAKEAPSAFGGTNLVAHLVDWNVDTVLVTGCTTSGCVRASVVDAYAYRYKVVVAEECVFDRAQVPHQVNLFDMAMKYADVLPTASVEAYLAALEPR